MEHPLHKYFKRSGETVGTLAATLRVSRQTIYNWLDGTSRPTLKRALVVSKLTGIPAARLLGL